MKRGIVNGFNWITGNVSKTGIKTSHLEDGDQ